MQFQFHQAALCIGSEYSIRIELEGRRQRQTDELGENFDDVHALVQLESKGDAQGMNSGFRGAIAGDVSNGYDSEE